MICNIGRSFVFSEFFIIGVHIRVSVFEVRIVKLVFLFLYFLFGYGEPRTRYILFHRVELRLFIVRVSAESDRRNPLVGWRLGRVGSKHVLGAVLELRVGVYFKEIIIV